MAHALASSVFCLSVTRFTREDTKNVQEENSTLFKYNTITACKHIVHACIDIHMHTHTHTYTCTRCRLQLWPSKSSTASCTQLHSHTQKSQVVHTVTYNKTCSTCTKIQTCAVASITVNSRLLKKPLQCIYWMVALTQFTVYQQYLYMCPATLHKIVLKGTDSKQMLRWMIDGVWRIDRIRNQI